jgi:hypothetical protein
MIARPSIIQRKFGLNREKASTLPVRTICVDADDRCNSNFYDAIVSEAVLRAKQAEQRELERQPSSSSAVCANDPACLS